MQQDQYMGPNFRPRATRLVRPSQNSGEALENDGAEKIDVASRPTIAMQAVDDALDDTLPKLPALSPSELNRTGTPNSNGQRTDITAQSTMSLKSMGSVSSSYTPPSLPTTPVRNLSWTGYANSDDDTQDVSNQSTRHLMQLSGMMRAIRPPQPHPNRTEQQTPSAEFDNAEREIEEDGWWPEGIQQTGPFPIVNIYGNKPFGQTLPRTPAVATVALMSPSATIAVTKPQPAWKALLGTPATKVILGLAVGVGLLFLVARFVDIPTTVGILKTSLGTPRGITLALLSGVAFLLAFIVRGIRWKLFLNPIGKVSTFKAIQLFLVGIFLNFLLPIRAGEVAKSLALKRVANIPISKSLPTVAMDKALDLMPALFIMAIVPLLGVQMDIKLWLVLGLVGGLLVGLIFFVVLAAWKRTAAIQLLQKMTGILPKSIGGKIAGFATGFVDSLLAGASQPRIFVPAILLTVVAVIFDGLFAMLAFWTIGFQISFGVAIFGYTVYNMFYILPTPPGQVGSNEAVGLLVFSGLLHLPADKVTAMFVFSHPWTAVLMATIGMACLSSLGLTISSAMKVQNETEDANAQAPLSQSQVQTMRL